MGDRSTDFVSADPWFRPEAARIEEACELLRRELAASDKVSVRDGAIVSLFLSPEGSHESRCPHCGWELREEELSAWLSEDYANDVGFRLQPRTMACCGSKVALNQLVYEQQFAYARFGIEVLNPQWKFQAGLASEQEVRATSVQEAQADRGAWNAKLAAWGQDLVAGEKAIASRLEPILGCRLILVHEPI